MEQYVKYLRKSRFDRDYAELSIEETLKRHEAILDKLAGDRGYHIAKTYYEKRNFSLLLATLMIFAVCFITAAATDVCLSDLCHPDHIHRGVRQPLMRLHLRHLDRGWNESRTQALISPLVPCVTLTYK